MAEDGGYYAIKGFRYQFDKAILEMLSAGDEDEIFIESIQDISTNSYVMQVKHREKAKLVPSALRKPIVGLINEFVEKPQLEYILYSFFGDLNNNENLVRSNGKITLVNLDKILGVVKSTFNKKLRREFLRKFRMDLSDDFQIQFEKVIKLLVSAEFAKNRDEAIVVYDLIANYIQLIVSDNPEPTNRVFSKASVSKMLDERRAVIFKSSYRNYLGARKYFLYIRKKYFIQQNIDDHERVIIICRDLVANSQAFSELLSIISKKFYSCVGPAGKKVIKSRAPYVFLESVTASVLINIKNKLSAQGVRFSDGYSYLGASFDIAQLRSQSNVVDGVKLKILSTANDANELINSKIEIPRKVYHFFKVSQQQFGDAQGTIDIQVKSILDIKEILK